MIRRLDREGNGLPAPPVLSAPRTDAGSHGELTYCQPGLKQEVVAVGCSFLWDLSPPPQCRAGGLTGWLPNISRPNFAIAKREHLCEGLRLAEAQEG
jgi:hypothetical protein